MRWHTLEVYFIFAESLLESIGTFVVQDVEFGGKAIGLELGVEAGPGVCELTGLSCLEWLGEDGVAVMIVEDHDVVVATRRLDGKLPGLIGVGFPEVGGRQDGGEYDVGLLVAGFL